MVSSAPDVVPATSTVDPSIATAVASSAPVLPSWTVKAVVAVPGGAHPSYAQGYYKRDNAFYKAWDEIARDRDTFLAWMDENVLKKGPEVFAVHAKKAA